MKNLRQEAILKIIEEQPVSTQEGLVAILQSRGWNVTQATVSRDIKDLGLRKSFDGKVNRYARPSADAEMKKMPAGANTIMRNGVIDVISAQNFVIVKCYAGMANAVCATIDHMNLQGIAGSIAGDDTIFICTLNKTFATQVRDTIMSIRG